MNKNRRAVVVPQKWVERGLEWGKALVAHYANGGSPRSRAVSGDRGTEKNPKRLAQGKIGEAATALYLGLDPETAIKLDMVADHGTDIFCSNGARLDVKTTFPPFKLIWSRDVNHLFAEKSFNVLVSVSIDQNNFSNCWVEGWILKWDFYKVKQISDGINSNLEPDTWFVGKNILSDIDDLHLLRL